MRSNDCKRSLPLNDSIWLVHRCHWQTPNHRAGKCPHQNWIKKLPHGLICVQSADYRLIFLSRCIWKCSISMEKIQNFGEKGTHFPDLLLIVLVIPQETNAGWAPDEWNVWLTKWKRSTTKNLGGLEQLQFHIRTHAISFIPTCSEMAKDQGWFGILLDIQCSCFGCNSTNKIFTLQSQCLPAESVGKGPLTNRQKTTCCPWFTVHKKPKNVYKNCVAKHCCIKYVQAMLQQATATDYCYSTNHVNLSVRGTVAWYNNDIQYSVIIDSILCVYIVYDWITQTSLYEELCCMYRVWH